MVILVVLIIIACSCIIQNIEKSSGKKININDLTYLSMRSKFIFGISFDVGCKTNHLIATLIGVVKHEVNKSAGRSGFMGSTWFAPQAASCIQFLKDGGGGILFPSFCCWATDCFKKNYI